MSRAIESTNVSRISITASASFDATSVCKPNLLLPLPAPQFAGDAQATQMGELYLLTVQQRNAHIKSAERHMEVANVASKKALNDELEALARKQAASEESGKGFFDAIGDIVGDFIGDVATLQLDDVGKDLERNCEDAWNSPRFWKELESGAMSVAKVAAVVGAAAATVVTCGAAGPLAVVAIAGVCLSGAAVVDGEFHVLEKCGVDAKVAGYIDMGMGIGGAVMSGGAGLAGGATAATTGARVATVVSDGANVVAAGGYIAGGAAHVRNGEFQARVQEAVADARSARATSDQIARMVQLLIAGLKETTDSSKRALESLHGAMQTHAETNILCAGRA